MKNTSKIKWRNGTAITHDAANSEPATPMERPIELAGKATLSEIVGAERLAKAFEDKLRPKAVEYVDETHKLVDTPAAAPDAER